MQTEILPVLGLDLEFPDQLYVLHHTSTRRYGCYCHQNVHGLACFSTETGAAKFGQFIELSGLQIVELSFEEAREIAKDRPMPVTSLMLLDNMSDPMIHYVR
ncbi:MAG TPA: hypothetical protein VK171_04085 [Fimbriimonas sp.]|nr:hypothetical protein [Fimbriimonas sp.]